MNRTCPHCQHPFDPGATPPAECPVCHQQITVTDWSSNATLEFDVKAELSEDSPSNDVTIETTANVPVSPSQVTLTDATLVDFPAVPVIPSVPPADKTVPDIQATLDDIPPVSDPNKTAAGIDQTIDIPSPQPRSADAFDERNVGMTIQQGKWEPTAAEIAAAITVDEPTQKHDSGITPPNLRDLTIVWGNVGESGSNQPASPNQPTADSSFIAASSAPRSPTEVKPESTFNSLEYSLVIQPRVLRQQSEIAPPVGERIDYNLLKKLGEGGMGIVFAARQASIRRTVALKMLKPATSKEGRQREKFLAEAVITGDLEHPNIIPIYDLGRDETGAIFYAMKHVKGTPWDKLIDHKSLPENLEILMKVADGVGFAHSRGVVHRDLKPENIMLGGYGEVLVMDWGLALSLNNPPAHVSMGGTPAYMAPEMAVGPVSAIGPASDVYLLGAILFEIVTGKRPHAGSTLTKCLMSAARNEIVETEKGGELLEIAHRAMQTNPSDRYQSVSDFQTAIRTYQSHTESIALATRAQQDLETARQDHRYETYARALFAFQEAVSLWDGNVRAQAGIIEAAHAYAAAALAKGDFDLGLSLLDPQESQHKDLLSELQTAKQERESRQSRLRAARRIGVALVATIFLIISGAFFWIRAEAERARRAEADARESEKSAKRERAIAVEQRKVAEEQEKIAVEQRKVADEERSKAILAQKEAERERQVAERERQVAERERMIAEQQRKLADDERIKAIAAEKVADMQRRTAEEQKAAAIAARQEEQRQRQLADQAREQEEYEGYVARLGLAAAKIQENAYDHAHTLLQSCPPRLRNWEWGRLAFLCQQQSRSFDCEQPLEALAVSKDGLYFAAGGWGGKVRVVSLSTEVTQKPLEINTGAEYVFALAFSPDGKELAIGTNAKPEYLSLWNPRTGERLGGLKGHTDAVLSVVYSRDGKQLLTGSYDKTARLWNRTQGTSVPFIGHDWWVWSANFSPDEQRIVTASQDGTVFVWPIATRKPSPPFLGHSGPVYAAAFSPDGKMVASASHDRRILLWNPNDLREQSLEEALRTDVAPKVMAQPISFESHTAPVRSLHFSPDGKLLVSGSYDNSLCLWDVTEQQLLKKFRGHGSRVSAALFTPDGENLLSASYDHRVQEWSIARYEEIRVLGGRVLQGHRDAILGAAFSPDGKTVVTASRDRSAMAWDVASGKPLQKFREGHAYLASTALFFPDGKRVLTAAVDNTARIWDIASGTQVASLEGTGPHAAAAFLNRGNLIISGSDDNTLKIWDATGKLVRQIPGFKSEVTAVAVSPDEKLVLAGNGSGYCRLLKADSGETIWESRAHSRGISAAVFLPRGRVLSASLDHTVAQWDIATGKEVRDRVLKHPDAVTSLAVNFDGTKALTACADRVVRLWDVEQAKILYEFPANEAGTSDVTFAPNGRRAAFVTADNRVQLWDLEKFQEVTTGQPAKPFLDLSAATLMVWGATFSADGGQLLTVGGSEAHLWDAAAAKLLVTFSPQSAVASVQFSADGKQIVTGGWDNAARVWNAGNGAALIKLSGVHTRFVNASVFSPDGTRVLTASDDGTARLWNASTGESLGELKGHQGRVTDVAFSSNGKLALTASDDKTARIWDLETLQTKHVLRGHEQGVLCARFSRDDTRIITGSDDTTARIWDVATGEALKVVLKGHTASVTSVAFTPDSSRVLTGSKDITAKLWDPATGKEILTLTGHTQEITTVAVAKEGDMLLTGSRDGTAIIWRTVPWHDGKSN